MLGCESAARLRASRSKRAMKCGSRERRGASTFTATRRLSERCMASHTVPMPPRPISRSSTHWPSTMPGASADAAASAGAARLSDSITTSSLGGPCTGSGRSTGLTAGFVSAAARVLSPAATAAAGAPPPAMVEPAARSKWVPHRGQPTRGPSGKRVFSNVLPHLGQVIVMAHAGEQPSYHGCSRAEKPPAVFAMRWRLARYDMRTCVPIWNSRRRVVGVERTLQA